MNEHIRMAMRNLSKVADEGCGGSKRESTSLFVIAQMSIAIAEALELIAERTRHPQPTQCSCQKRYR